MSSIDNAAAVAVALSIVTAYAAKKKKKSAIRKLDLPVCLEAEIGPNCLLI